MECKHVIIATTHDKKKCKSWITSSLKVYKYVPWFTLIYLQCLEATTMLFQAKEGFYFHSNTFFYS